MDFNYLATFGEISCLVGDLPHFHYLIVSLARRSLDVYYEVYGFECLKQEACQIHLPSP